MCRSSSQIIDSFARCQITANSHVGGISGTMENTGVITNCYSASSLNCESMDGGITGGNITGEIASSYWDTDLSGVTFNVFGEARTTTQMTFPINNDTYIGWDFVDIWCADVNFTVNAGYPYLLEEPVDIDDENLPQTPLRYNLTAYPNPFLTTAYIMIKQDNASGIKPVKVFTMTIYNLRGQKVSNLPVISNGFDDMISFWDGHDSRGRSCSEGIYVSILYADGKPCSGTRLTLLRK